MSGILRRVSRVFLKLSNRLQFCKRLTVNFRVMTDSSSAIITFSHADRHLLIKMRPRSRLFLKLVNGLLKLVLPRRSDGLRRGGNNSARGSPNDVHSSNGIGDEDITACQQDAQRLWWRSPSAWSAASRLCTPNAAAAAARSTAAVFVFPAAAPGSD